jgi:hypothetical protein
MAVVRRGRVKQLDSDNAEVSSTIRFLIAVIETPVDAE